MTKIEALEVLKETRQLNTVILDPLDLTFEYFLRFSQLDEKRCKMHIDRIIRREEKKISLAMQQKAKQVQDRIKEKK